MALKVFYAFILSNWSLVYVHVEASFKQTLIFTSIDSRQTGVTFVGLSLQQCVRNCELRLWCEMLTYHRRALVCSLHETYINDEDDPTVVESSPGSSINVIRIERQHIVPEVRRLRVWF